MDSERRIIQNDGPDADQDRIRVGPQLLDPREVLRPGEKGATTAGIGESTVRGSGAIDPYGGSTENRRLSHR